MADTRSWTETGLDDAVRRALTEGLAASELAFVASGFGSQLAAFACRR